MSTGVSVATALTLLALKRVGRRTARQLCERLCDAPEDVGDLRSRLMDVSGQISRFKPPSLEELKQAAEQAAQVIEQAHTQGIAVVGYWDSAFPCRLREIPDPPIVLFVRGSVDVLQAEACVAVIGSRKPSEEGRQAAARIGHKLACQQVVVVSGLAIGCDAEAHSATVEAKGKGIAVLAHGLDTVSPASNKLLAEALIENGGCLVSEYPCGVKAQKRNFVDRDRLQSGLSHAVVLVEATAGSGSMHTVGFAELQQRPLAAVAYSSSQDSATGNNMLLAAGKARPLTTLGTLGSWLKEVLPQAEITELDRTDSLI